MSQLAIQPRIPLINTNKILLIIIGIRDKGICRYSKKQLQGMVVVARFVLPPKELVVKIQNEPLPKPDADLWIGPDFSNRYSLSVFSNPKICVMAVDENVYRENKSEY